MSHWPTAALGRQGGVQAGPLGRRPLWLGWAPDAVSWASVQMLQTACRCCRQRAGVHEAGRADPALAAPRTGKGLAGVSPLVLPLRVCSPPQDCHRSPLTRGEPVGSSDVVYPEDGNSECPPLLC